MSNITTIMSNDTTIISDATTIMPNATTIISNATTIMSNATSINSANDSSLPSANPVFVKYYPYLIGEMSLSIISLVILILVYCVLREHKTVPGKIVLSLSCCMIASYILLIIDFRFRMTVPKLPCLIMATTVHATFLATFFWTNVMAYDIMKTLSSMSTELSSSTRYFKYSLYAWTMTIVCTIPAIVIDYGKLLPDKYRPNFGKHRCWLSGTPAFLLYFNGPVGVILLANCILFIITAVKITNVRSAVARLQAKPHRKRFRLYVKLVLVMGLVWITEFIPWITGIYKLYVIAGLLNCLHGVFMFLIFACKIRIFKQMKENFMPKLQKPAAIGAARQQSPSLATLTTVISKTSLMDRNEKLSIENK